MAADRQRLAQALAAEAARRKMFESIPEAAGQGLPQAPERPMGWNDYLENLSIGLGRGAVNNLEGIKGMVASPVETLKGVATNVTEAVRNPRMVAEALKQTGQRAMSGPLGLGEVIGENVNMMRVPNASEMPTEILNIAKPIKTQAKIGGEIAESNGYFYKGGQFLPSTEAEPGKWKIGKKIVTTGKEFVAPGEMATQPTPFSRSIYQAALGRGDFVTQTPEGLKVREGVKTSLGEPVTPEMKIRLGVKGVLGKEELTLQEFVDAYNNGQRWFDVQPDAPTIKTK